MFSLEKPGKCIHTHNILIYNYLALDCHPNAGKIVSFRVTMSSNNGEYLVDLENHELLNSKRAKDRDRFRLNLFMQHLKENFARNKKVMPKIRQQNL